MDRRPSVQHTRMSAAVLTIGIAFCPSQRLALCDKPKTTNWRKSPAVGSGCDEVKLSALFMNNHISHHLVFYLGEVQPLANARWAWDTSSAKNLIYCRFQIPEPMRPLRECARKQPVMPNWPQTCNASGPIYRASKTESAAT